MARLNWIVSRYIVIAVNLFALAVSSMATASTVRQVGEYQQWFTWADAEIQRIIDISDDQRTYDNTVGAIDDILARVEIETSFPQVMHYVSPDPKDREVGQQVEVISEEWKIKARNNRDLYLAVQAYADSNPSLTGERKRLLEFMIRDYRRAGMHLPDERRARLEEIQKETSRLSIEFSKNTREDETTVLLTVDELAGVPEDVIGGMDRLGDLCIVSLDYPTVSAIWDQAHDENARKKIWVAYKRRGGEKNVRLLEKIIALRAEEARLLGYESYADYMTEPRMAKEAANVQRFYDELRPLVRKKAKQDWDLFVATKRAHTGNPEATFNPWDFSYYEKLLLKRDYAVDTARVQEYFPLDRVLDGFYRISGTLYGLEYRDITEQARAEGKPFWHEDVQLLEVRDRERGEVLGEMYMDLHPRPNKADGAFQWGYTPRKVWSDGTVSTPSILVMCNFTKPTAQKPSLLRHDEVVTLFHEFGHFLHTIVCEAATQRFSGGKTEDDFVEAPSQMLENWVWDADVLRTFARHYETGEPLPDELLDGMLAARNLGSGMLAEHQFYYGMLDQAFNSDADGGVDTTQIRLELFDEVELYDSVPHTYVQAGFRHFVNPLYIAGYYGYQWSLVYASDLYQHFKELGLMSPEVGAAYRQAVLAPGGTRDGMDMLRDFLGRDPDMQAYLVHLGLDAE